VAISSMTGYARAQDDDESFAWVWEAKSVNGRGLEVRMRLPPGYDRLEPAVREAVQGRCRRGNVNLTLTVEPRQSGKPMTVNQAVLDQYLDLARACAERMPGLAAARVDGLLALRGVIEMGDAAMVEPPEQTERRSVAVLATLVRALQALATMRAGEGERLRGILDGQLTEIGALVAKAETLPSLDKAHLKEKLRLQVTALLDAVPTLSEDRLTQEAVLIAAKADIREELDRLKAHGAAARDMLASDESVGRKLDFLCQEFNREANTLCSKAGDLELTRIGLSLKAIIEQFREQVQNIE
jgi:uncharacterized protein (TIGR00255 family)